MSDPSVIHFTRPRTYLDECRDQGIYQMGEELLAENAELSKKLAAMAERREARKVHRLANHNPSVAIFASGVDAERHKIFSRLETILDAYSRVIDPDFAPLLKHILQCEEIDVADAEGILSAALLVYCNPRSGAHDE